MIFLGFMNIGGQEVLFILLIVLLLFGAKKLPELARGMGSAIKEFQKAKDEINDELHAAGKTDETSVRKPEATVPRIENTPPTASAGGDVPREDQSRRADHV